MAAVMKEIGIVCLAIDAQTGSSFPMRHFW
jgi:hypothetical protein